MRVCVEQAEDAGLFRAVEIHALESWAEIPAHLGEAESEEGLDQSARDVGQTVVVFQLDNVIAVSLLVDALEQVLVLRFVLLKQRIKLT